MKTARYPNLVLAIGYDAPSGSEGYAHVRGWITAESGRGLYGSDPGGKFRSVVFNAQTDRDHLIRQEGLAGTMYGYEVEWKGEGRGLGDMKAGVVALTEIGRKMDKAEADLGPAASFGAWVQRVAFAIGIDKVQLPNPNHNRLDESPTLIRTPNQAAYSIDARIRDWRDTARAAAGVFAD